MDLQLLTTIQGHTLRHPPAYLATVPSCSTRWPSHPTHCLSNPVRRSSRVISCTLILPHLPFVLSHLPLVPPYLPVVPLPFVPHRLQLLPSFAVAHLACSSLPVMCATLSAACPVTLASHLTRLTGRSVQLATSLAAYCI